MEIHNINPGDDEEPDEIEQLELIVEDLTRRLKNAHHTIETERTIARNATAQAEFYRQKLGEVSKMLHLEGAKAFNLEQKAIQHTESVRFESNKQRAGKLHEQLRIAELDHMMTGNKKEPLKLTKLRGRVQSLEVEQNSQKVFLQELTEIDDVNEQLTSAAQLGNLDECNRLLRYGAWANYVDSAGFLALHYAASSGFHDITKLLLEFGADPTSYLSGQSALVLAASNGHINTIKLLLGFGADIEDVGRGGCPATIAALMNGHLDAFEFLLSSGANINSIDTDENSALHIATRLPPSQVAQVITFLIEQGCDTQRVNRRGQTPLKLALYEQRKDAVYALNKYSSTAGQHEEEEEEEVGVLGSSNMSDIRQIEGSKDMLAMDNIGSLSGRNQHSSDPAVVGGSGNDNKLRSLDRSNRANNNNNNNSNNKQIKKQTSDSRQSATVSGSGSAAVKQQRSNLHSSKSGPIRSAKTESATTTTASNSNRASTGKTTDGKLNSGAGSGTGSNPVRGNRSSADTGPSTDVQVLTDTQLTTATAGAADHAAAANSALSTINEASSAGNDSAAQRDVTQQPGHGQQEAALDGDLAAASQMSVISGITFDHSHA